MRWIFRSIMRRTVIFLKAKSPPGKFFRLTKGGGKSGRRDCRYHARKHAESKTFAEFARRRDFAGCGSLNIGAKISAWSLPKLLNRRVMRRGLIKVKYQKTAAKVDFEKEKSNARKSAKTRRRSSRRCRKGFSKCRFQS